MRDSLPRLYRMVPLLAITLMVAGCDLVGDILELGFWAGVIILLVVIAIIWWIAKKLGSGRRGPPPPAA